MSLGLSFREQIGERGTNCVKVSKTRSDDAQVPPLEGGEFLAKS